MYLSTAQGKQTEGKGMVKQTQEGALCGERWGQVLFRQFSCKSEILSK